MKGNKEIGARRYLLRVKVPIGDVLGPHRKDFDVAAEAIVLSVENLGKK
jgi:hypothetical protein